MSAFDPYHKWLGIPPLEQPPNYYRLLGIAVFESDPEVIEAAADQRMAFVRQLAIGQYVELSQRLLGELACARRCLSDRTEKQTYDLTLRQVLECSVSDDHSTSDRKPGRRPVNSLKNSSQENSSKLLPSGVAASQLGAARLTIERSRRSPLVLLAFLVAMGACAAPFLLSLSRMGMNGDSASATGADNRQIDSELQPAETGSAAASDQASKTAVEEQLSIPSPNPHPPMTSTPISTIPNPELRLEMQNQATVAEGEEFVAYAKGTGLAASKLEYSLSSDAPAGCTINARTGVVTWTPTEDQGPGEYPLVVIVRAIESPQLKTQHTCRVKVTEVTQPPRIDPVPNQLVQEGSTLSLVVVAKDLDRPSRPLIYSLQTSEEIGALIDTASGRVTWLPQPDHIGKQFRFRVLADKADLSLSPNPTAVEFFVTVKRTLRADVIFTQNVTGANWEFFLAQNEAALKAQMSQALTTKYRPINLLTYVDEQQTRYASTWMSDTTPWNVYYDVDRVTRQKIYDNKPKYNRTAWTSYTSQRCNLIFVESASLSRWEVRGGFTATGLDQFVSSYFRSSKLRPLAVWCEGSGRYGAHLDEAPVGGYYWREQSAKQISQILANVPPDYRPVTLDGYGLGANRRYCPVTSSDGQTLKWDFRLAVPISGLTAIMDAARGAGMMPHSIDIE